MLANRNGLGNVTSLLVVRVFIPNPFFRAMGPRNTSGPYSRDGAKCFQYKPAWELHPKDHQY